MPSKEHNKQRGQSPLRLFAMTAALFLCSVVGGLTILGQTQSRFSASVREVDSWTQTLNRFDRVSRQLDVLGAPANDIFESFSAPKELANLESAADELEVAVEDLQRDLRSRTDVYQAQRLASLLEDLRPAMADVKNLSRQTISQYSQGRTNTAALTMARHDTELGKISETVFDAKGLIYRLEAKYLIRQKALAQQSKTRSRILALAGVAALVVVWLFGRRVARLQRRQTAERADQLAALARSESELRAYNRKLADSNRDLTDFAYVASHDLQEPLRKIIAFGDRLSKKFGEQLGDDGSDYLSRMQSAAARMQVLIEDLLTFSRVSTRGEAFRITDLNEVAAGVVSDLEIAIERAKATVEIGPLPTLDVDALQLRQLLQNLLGNAIKFRREGVVPFVSVQSKRVDPRKVPGLPLDTEPTAEFWQIDVRDNGIGFEQKYADKVFTVFQRLHGRSEYEGSGIGLSVVRRIVERHQGVVTVESEPGVGTTFHIVLPRHPVEFVAFDSDDVPTIDRETTLVSNRV